MGLTLSYTKNNGAEYWRNKPNKKDSWLKEETTVGTFSVPKGCFFQVNPYCCDILLEKVQEKVKEIAPKTVIDLYCGSGIFAIASAMADVEQVVGIDCEEKSIEAAKYNAKSRNLENCEFIPGDAEKLTNKTLRGVEPENTLLIIDPPRNGLGRKARGAIKASGIKDIIYISCGPDTLMRDLKDLMRKGYKLESTQMVDMFPRTSHFETISYLKKEN
jgi:tRNA/tmRNA/rRNA uracil-C5-methylase (TrmA/RlmC/RlmD family)